VADDDEGLTPIETEPMTGDDKSTDDALLGIETEYETRSQDGAVRSRITIDGD
jgi:hypothetical protein